MIDSQLHPILGRRGELNIPKYWNVFEEDLDSAHPLRGRRGDGGGRVTICIQSLKMLDDDGSNYESKCLEISDSSRYGIR
jgi:hypothetical protein